ncbi:unnamed protein product [Auanema sp. JU1783]|nr:unnamed protein product [Auanema sp. JU1783]
MTIMLRALFLFLFLIFSSQSAHSYQGALNRLTRHLLAQHDKNAPPDGAVIVTHEMELVHILNIDELKQSMRVLVYIVEEWTDPSLSWDPASFSGVNITWLPEHSIWVPDILVFNMLDHQDLLHSVRSPIKVYHTGRVWFSYPAIYSVMCTIGVAKFPFDDQTCRLRIASWGYPEGKLYINATRMPYLTHYSPNEEWALQSVNISSRHYEHEGTIVSEACYLVSVSRKPFYYLVSLVIPTYIICMLSVSGLFARFSTRHERQERFTLGVTSILSMAVLSVVVTEKVPHSSEEVPLLVTYFHFNMVIVTIATILTSSVMRVDTKGYTHDKSPPRWITSILLIRTHRWNRTQQANNGEIATKRQVRHLLAKQWGEVSRRMDYGLLLVFLLFISAPTVYLFYLCAVMDNMTPERVLLETRT